METLRRKFDGSHELVQLITQCLEYFPARRPSVSEALQRLQHISSQVVDHYHNMTRLQLEKLLIEKDELLIEKDKKIEQGQMLLMEKKEKSKQMEDRMPTMEVKVPSLSDSISTSFILLFPPHNTQPILLQAIAIEDKERELL